jgi:hypothetical protein
MNRCFYPWFCNFLTKNHLRFETHIHDTFLFGNYRTIGLHNYETTG